MLYEFYYNKNEKKQEPVTKCHANCWSVYFQQNKKRESRVKSVTLKLWWAEKL